MVVGRYSLFVIGYWLKRLHAGRLKSLKARKHIGWEAWKLEGEEAQGFMVLSNVKLL
jgi:hypothetical protein